MDYLSVIYALEKVEQENTKQQEKIKMADRHPVQITDERWKRLWSIAKKRKEPTTPAQIINEAIDRYCDKQSRRKK